MQLHRVQAQAKLGQRSSAGRSSPVICYAFRRNAAPSVAGLRSAIVPAMQEPGVQSNRPQVALSATTKVSVGTLSVRAAVKPDSGSIVVLGSQGEAGAKLTKALLEAGFKVTAGVDFPEQAKATVAFAKRYELLSRQQLGNLKLVEADDALPSRSRVLIIEGDALGDKKTDERYVKQALQRAEAAGASQVVLVTTSTGSSGGFFSFGSSPTQPNRSLTRIEQLAAGSDVPVTVVRASTSDTKVAPDAQIKIVAGPGVLAPATAPVSQDMLAEVLGAVLTEQAGPAGVPVVLEVAATRAGQGVPLAETVARAVAEAKQKAPEPAPRAAAAPKAAAAAPAKSAAPAFALPAALGTIGISVRKAAAKQEEEEAPQRKGTQKVAVRPPTAAKRAPVDEDEDEEGAKEKPLGFLAGLFGGNTGTQRVSVKPAAPTAAPARVGMQGLRVGGTTKAGTMGVSAKAAPAPPAQRKPNPFSSVPTRRASPAPTPAPQPASRTVVKPAPAKSAPAPAPVKPAPSRGSNPLFGFFAINPTATADDEEEAPSKPAPRAAPKVAPKPAPKPAPKAAPAAARGRAADAEPVLAKPSSNNFFASLFGGKRKSDEDEDDEPVRPAARRPAPPPAKPAPKPAPAPARAASAKATTSSSAPAAPARSSNPFSSVKRVAPPPQPAASAKPAPKVGTTKTQAAPPKPGTTKVQAKPSPSGTSIKGTYRPVSGYSVEPKKK